MKGPKPQPPPRPVRLIALVTPADFLVGLKAAGVGADPPPELLEEAALTGTRLAQGVVSSLVVPPIPKMRASVAKVVKLEKVLNGLIVQLSGGPDDIEGKYFESQQAIQDYLRDHESPFLFNLTCHIGREAGHEDGRAKLADAIMSLQRVGAACASVVDAQRANLAGETTAREAPQMRSRQRELGFAFLASFQVMTGRAPKVSRASGGDKVGRLGGPLLRFMEAMFGRVRDNLRAEPTLAALAEDPALAPTAETVRSWMKIYKAKMEKATPGNPWPDLEERAEPAP